MSSLYGPDSYRHILSDSATGTVVVAEDYAERIRMVREDLPDLETLVIFGQPGEGERSQAEAAGFPAEFDPVDTSSMDPAMPLYTSGSTGHPKGALHGHRIIEGYLLTFKLFFNVDFDESTVFYTPSDWAWGGVCSTSSCPHWCSGIRSWPTRSVSRPSEPSRSSSATALHMPS